MHKKYQQIPCQFIPKTNHKYQLKKTLINTKFQWLMKYIKNQNEESEDTNLSKIIKIQIKKTIPFNDKKQTIPFCEKRTLKEHNNYLDNQSNELSRCKKAKERETLKTNKSMRPSVSINKGLNDEHIFMDKHKLRNRSILSRNIKRHKKVNTFFQKENNDSTAEGATTMLGKYKKVKTQASLDRIKTRNQIRARYQREPFVLSPWIFTEENIENSQQFKF